MARQDERSGARVTVYLEAPDPISTAGLAAHLRAGGGTVVVEGLAAAATAVLVVDAIDDLAAGAVRRLAGEGARAVVVIATVLDDLGVLRALEAGASGILHRSEVTSPRLAGELSAALAGHGTIPSDLIGSLLDHLGGGPLGAEPKGPLLDGFSEREIEVLRLVADGLGTGEIAETLSYSERTVKNVIHEVTMRFNLRNRSHAVAYALRAGVI